LKKDLHIPTKAHFIRAFGSYTSFSILPFTHALYDEEKLIHKSKRYAYKMPDVREMFKRIQFNPLKVARYTF